MDDQSGRNSTTQARQAIEIVCSGDLTRLDKYYSPEFVDHTNDIVYHGHEGLFRAADLYRGVFDEFRFEVVEQVSEGDRVVSRWILHGTCRNRKVKLLGMTLSHVDKQGRMAEDWGFTDTLSLLRQLGPFRIALLGIKVLTGRVRLPKSAPELADSRGTR
jgi:predicted ester cyclase